MTAPLSIIIPTLNAERALLRLLPQLFEGLTQGLIAELIFADGGSTDQTEAIAEEAGALFLTAPKGRGMQLKAGCEAAKGHFLLILHSDSQLPENWTGLVEAHMEGHSQKAAVFKLAFDADHPMAKLTAAWANLRTRLFNLPYGDQGLLISSRLYTQIGGYDPIPLMEDVALAKKLKGQIRMLPATIMTSAQKYRDQGWITCGARNLKTLIQFKLGKSPDRLAQAYDRANHKSS